MPIAGGFAYTMEGSPKPSPTRDSIIAAAAARPLRMPLINRPLTTSSLVRGLFVLGGRCWTRTNPAALATCGDAPRTSPDLHR
jgi:hypothetical protein